jgi:hypothetical protein
MGRYRQEGTGVTPEANRNGRLSLDGRALTKRVSLSLPSVMTLASWKSIGKEIALISDASTWWLGDWLVYGQKRYPDRYRKAIAETGLDYQTLRNYAWIARKFPAPRRHQNLSLQHHAEVAALSEEEQDLWLERAERERWSKGELRRKLRVARGRVVDTPAPDLRKLGLLVDAERGSRWEQAADLSGHTLETWMIEALDEAARRTPSITGLPVAS